MPAAFANGFALALPTLQYFLILEIQYYVRFGDNKSNWIINVYSTAFFNLMKGPSSSSFESCRACALSTYHVIALQR